MSEQMMFGDTLSAAKTRILHGRDEGIKCPCCGQFCKVYDRPIHASMAYTLIRLYRVAEGDDIEKYYHVERFCDRLGSGDFAKLLFWDLVEELEKDPEDHGRRTSGMWRITEKGIAFVKKQIRVERSVRLYNDEVLGFSTETVTILDCLRNKFDYHELMGGGLRK